MTVAHRHVDQLVRTCLKQQPIARTATSVLFVLFALVEIVLGFQDNCNVLVLSGFLHICHIIDLGTRLLPRFYHAVPGAPDGFYRFHLLVRLANLYLMVFLCFDSMVEAICDFHKQTDMRPDTVPLVLFASVVLHLITGAVQGQGSGSDMSSKSSSANASSGSLFGFSSSSAGSGSLFPRPPSTSFDEASSSNSSANANANASDNNNNVTIFTNMDDKSPGSVPAKVGSVAFLCFAVIQYILPHDQPVQWADSFATLVAAVAVVARSGPGLRNYTLFFMQASSRLKRTAATTCLQQIEGIPGIIECVRCCAFSFSFYFFLFFFAGSA